MDGRAAMDEPLRALADQTYQLGLHKILEVTATPTFVPGLLHSPPGSPLQPRELAACQLDLIGRWERQGARFEPGADVVLNSRMTRAVQYHDLRFRLARPQELDKYLAGSPLRPPRITPDTLAALVLADEVFHRHRAEGEPPAANLVQVVAKLRHPDLAVPRDLVHEVLRGNGHVVAMYGDPKQGPPKAWARTLYNSLKQELAALK
jgi:hypothetical protein